MTLSVPAQGALTVWVSHRLHEALQVSCMMGMVHKAVPSSNSCMQSADALVSVQVLLEHRRQLLAQYSAIYSSSTRAVSDPSRGRRGSTGRHK